MRARRFAGVVASLRILAWVIEAVVVSIGEVVFSVQPAFLFEESKLALVAGVQSISSRFSRDAVVGLEQGKVCFLSFTGPDGDKTILLG